MLEHKFVMCAALHQDTLIKLDIINVDSTKKLKHKHPANSFIVKYKKMMFLSLFYVSKTTLIHVLTD